LSLAAKHGFPTTPDLELDAPPTCIAFGQP
jgi:hypothetical protein